MVLQICDMSCELFIYTHAFSILCIGLWYEMIVPVCAHLYIFCMVFLYLVVYIPW